MQSDSAGSLSLRVGRPREEPGAFPILAHWKRAGGEEGAKDSSIPLAVLGKNPPAFARPMFMDGLVETRAVQRGMKSVINHVRQWPGRAVTRQGTFHGTAITEKQNICRLQENRVHAVPFGFELWLEPAAVRWANATVWQRLITDLSLSSEDAPALPRFSKKSRSNRGSCFTVSFESRGPFCRSQATPNSRSIISLQTRSNPSASVIRARPVDWFK
jgi:hypothetical protein